MPRGLAHRSESRLRLRAPRHRPVEPRISVDSSSADTFVGSGDQTGVDDMSMFNAFRCDGKRVVVVGAASGMGAAVAALVQDAGAEVVAMDFAEISLPGAKAVHVNLADA